MEQHQFALYVKDLPSTFKNNLYDIFDQELAHRMQHILRLKVEDTCVLFSQTIIVRCSIHALSKKSLSVKILSTESPHTINPAICVLLPFLKRVALEEALYTCTELGTQNIQLIYTAKTPHTKITQKELERYERIIIAAAEQSKHYAFPAIHAPLLLEEALLKWKTADTSFLFADPQGQSFTAVLKGNAQSRNLVLLIGPEGDLTISEKEFIKTQGASFVHLTPTILRAQQALTVFLGIIRSL